MNKKIRRPAINSEIILGLLEAVDFVQDDLAAGMRFSSDEEKDREIEDRYDKVCDYVHKLNEWWKQKKGNEHAGSE